jgi:hypothetical protein
MLRHVCERVLLVFSQELLEFHQNVGYHNVSLGRFSLLGGSFFS